MRRSQLINLRQFAPALRARVLPCLALSSLALACALARAEAPDDNNPMQLQADHVTASVANLDKEEAWYVNVFGFREIVRHNRGPDFEVRHLTMGTWHIDLAWQRGSVRQKELSYYRQGWEHVVFTTPILESAYNRLKAMGTDAKADLNAKGQPWRIYLHDPEGNEIEIVASDGETRAALPQFPTDIPESILPAGDNRQLVVRACVVCHPVQTVVVAKHTPAEWDVIMQRMMTRGTVATPDEQKLILAYLNGHFGL
jgi:catechol 2,3-dioxygenase-like lactoylglutathione lyase family enzyme